jgi:hypothetical protein
MKFITGELITCTKNFSMIVYLMLELPLWEKDIEGTIRLYNSESSPLKICWRPALLVPVFLRTLVCGLLFALQHLSGGKEMERRVGIGRSRVEWEIIGLQGGIMDQFATSSEPEHRDDA